MLEMGIEPKGISKATGLTEKELQQLRYSREYLVEDLQQRNKKPGKTVSAVLPSTLSPGFFISYFW